MIVNPGAVPKKERSSVVNHQLHLVKQGNMTQRYSLLHFIATKLHEWLCSKLKCWGWAYGRHIFVV